MATLEESDRCTVFYNAAVLLYQMRQYQSALMSAEKLFRFIGQIGNALEVREDRPLAEFQTTYFHGKSAFFSPNFIYAHFR